MGPSDAEITYGFHGALPSNGTDGFFLGELVSRQLNHRCLTIDLLKIVVLKHLHEFYDGIYLKLFL